MQEIDSKVNLLHNDIKLLRQQIRYMKESILARHEDIKKEITPKVEVLEKYFESISNEAHTMNEDAIANLKAMKDFNLKSQEEILAVSGKVNAIYRKVGEFN